MLFTAAFVTTFSSETQDLGLFNVPLFIGTILFLLIALYMCVRITRRNRLYIHHKRKPRAKAYI